jgi:hypothetical protein
MAALLLAFGLIMTGCETPNSPAESEVVTELNLTGKVRAPVKDEAPVTTFTATAQYTGAIAWKTAEDNEVSGNFAAGTVYQAVVTLTAKEGYTFAGVAANAFTYSGATSVTNAKDSGTVTISFPATAAEGAGTTVTALDLTGKVTAPVKDKAPVTTFTATAQYTGAIVWKTAEDNEVSGNFAAGTVYKAVVSLTAKEGYTFTGVAANAFTYTGATVTNAANSGTVTISFPATGADLLPALENALKELGDTTAESPFPVILEAFAITANGRITGDWGTVSTAVEKAKKHVILDLSNCTFEDNEITGFISGFYGMRITIMNSKYIKGIILPGSVASIGDEAFSDCKGLTSVTIPEGVTSIGKSAFYGCTGLTGVTIPEGVTSIGEYAFSGCAGLASVTIPASVTSIGNHAFSRCSGLASVTIPEGVCSIEVAAFYGCAGLTGVTIPEGVTSIGEYAFSGCTGLAEVTIPEGVTSIEEGAFSGCTGLAEVTIPEGVTSIGKSAFSGCTGLTGVTIPAGVTSIGVEAFSGCTGLASVTIPEGVTSIGEYAFRNCSGLTGVTIPASVPSIGMSAFDGCTGLASVTFERGGVFVGLSGFPKYLINVYEYTGGGAGTYTLIDKAWTKTS